MCTKALSTWAVVVHSGRCTSGSGKSDSISTSSTDGIVLVVLVAVVWW